MFSKLKIIDDIGLHVYATLDPDTAINEIKNNMPEVFFIGVVDGKKDINSLFRSFSEAFSFPDYFGYNWPAFDECLNDLDWLDAKGYVIIIKNAEVLTELKNEFKLLIKTLSNAASEWSTGRQNDSFPTQPTPFHVLFLVGQKHKNCFVKALRESGCSQVNILTE